MELIQFCSQIMHRSFLINYPPKAFSFPRYPNFCVSLWKTLVSPAYTLRLQFDASKTQLMDFFYLFFDIPFLKIDGAEADEFITILYLLV